MDLPLPGLDLYVNLIGLYIDMLLRFMFCH